MTSKPQDCSHDHNHDHDHDHHPDEHAHGHGHHHHHHAVGNIRIAFFLNLIFSLVEVVGGYWIGSLTIMAGAIHDLGDALSLGSAWFLEKFANRKRDENFNFGYRRFSMLSALIAGIIISSGSVIIVIQAILRFNDPHVPPGPIMMLFAVLGLAVNGVAAWRLSHGKSMNEKILTWHLIEDIASWTIVLIGGGLVWLTGWSWLDPVMAIGLALFIAFNVLKHLKETIYLFLQGRPTNFDEELFRREALAVAGVEKIDHLAVWSLDGENSILSARLHIHGVTDTKKIEELKTIVRAAAERQHATATLETCLADHGHDHLHDDQE